MSKYMSACATCINDAKTSRPCTRVAGWSGYICPSGCLLEYIVSISCSICGSCVPVRFGRKPMVLPIRSLASTDFSPLSTPSVSDLLCSRDEVGPCTHLPACSTGYILGPCTHSPACPTGYICLSKYVSACATCIDDAKTTRPCTRVAS